MKFLHQDSRCSMHLHQCCICNVLRGANIEMRILLGVRILVFTEGAFCQGSGFSFHGWRILLGVRIQCSRMAHSAGRPYSVFPDGAFSQASVFSFDRNFCSEHSQLLKEFYSRYLSLQSCIYEQSTLSCHTSVTFNYGRMNSGRMKFCNFDSCGNKSSFFDYCRHVQSAKIPLLFNILHSKIIVLRINQFIT